MNRCPITYEICQEGQKYTIKGLSHISKNLNNLKDFPYTAEKQIEIALDLATKLSIQGIQPKLSVRLNVRNEEFEVVIKNGEFIIKPPSQLFEELPQNEDLTMHLAAISGIDVPLHGMIYNIDGTMSYFIKRFDRDKGDKIAVEDFSQILQNSRDTKYDSSMEKVIGVIEKHCTFPLIEKLKLFRLVIFNFIVGNEDMHLKNFTLIRKSGQVALSPAYDLINTTIALKNPIEEIALPIRGKKNRISRDDLLNYFGMERCKLHREVLEEEINKFESLLGTWKDWINNSFLSEKRKKMYQQLIDERWQRLKKD